jgi:hypothetical protein
MNCLAGNRVVMPPGASWAFRGLLVAALAVCGAIVLADRSAAQAVKYNEHERKALMLYKLAMYIEWPRSALGDANAPFVVGILGKDPIGSGTDVLRGKIVHGHRVEVRPCSKFEELTTCHLVFISKSEMEKLPQILKRLENSSILTTAEAQGFIEQEGIINLVPRRQANGTETVGFEINRRAADKANLKLDAKLLELASRVIS